MKLFSAVLFSSSLLVLSTLARAESPCANEEHFPLITKSELKQVVDQGGAFVVDVNSKKSFKKAHVPSAIHFASNEKTFETMLPKDKSALIVAYCGGPSCTAWHKAAQKACEMGYTNVKHFKEGISGWTKS